MTTTSSVPSPPRPRLLRLPDFRRLWIGDTVSQAGAAVTVLALPLVAMPPRSSSPGSAVPTPAPRRPPAPGCGTRSRRA
ncbi:hypothetical protein [Streptomyces sp. NPDC093089]|uniref:hypothetical protein n=1 Tax=Streptomyces sp. NPDC093089 TaxID=3366024 RepID=UPI0037FA6276